MLVEVLKNFANIDDPLLALSVAVDNHGFVVSLARLLRYSSVSGTIKIDGKKIYISLWKRERTYFARVCVSGTKYQECYRFRSRHLKRLLRRIYIKIKKLGGGNGY